MMILATADAVAQPGWFDSLAGMFPPYFGVMLLALVVVAAVAAVLMLLGYKVIDKITPGNLSHELLGRLSPPNLALALVVASMIIGGAMILSATIIGVLLH